LAENAACISGAACGAREPATKINIHFPSKHRAGHIAASSGSSASSASVPERVRDPAEGSLILARSYR
jgi:hypothetical protein